MDDPTTGPDLGVMPDGTDDDASTDLRSNRGPLANPAVPSIVAVVALTLFILGCTRPFDIAVLPTWLDVILTGLVGFAAVVAMGVLLQGSRVVRPLAFLVGGLGVLVMLAAAAFVLVTGADRTPAAEVAIPDTDLTMVVASGEGPLAEDELVLLGSIGPLPRRRLVASLSHSCTASIRPLGSRTIEATTTETTEACGTLGRGGTYLIEVGGDGWSTTIERIPDQ